MSRLRVFTVLSFLSMLLFLGTCMLWIWSDFVPRHHLTFMHGSLSLLTSPNHVVYAGPPTTTQTFMSPGVDAFTFPVSTVVVFPDWEIALAFVLFPFIWFTHVRGRSVGTGELCCRKCGYDLRASPDRCPECGTPVDDKIHTNAATRSRRRFNALAGVSLAIFVVLLVDSTSRAKLSNVIAMPAPARPATTTQAAGKTATSQTTGVTTFNYHVSSRSSVVRHYSYAFFGGRIPFHPALVLAAILPVYWVVLRLLRPEKRRGPDRRRLRVSNVPLP